MPANAKPPTLYLTIKEVASILHTKPDWIWRRIRDGEIKSTKEHGRHLIALRDLRRYVIRKSRSIPELSVVVYFEDSGRLKFAGEVRGLGDYGAAIADMAEQSSRSVTALDR